MPTPLAPSIITNLFHIQTGHRLSNIGMRTGLKTYAIIGVPLMQTILHHRVVFAGHCVHKNLYSIDW